MVLKNPESMRINNKNSMSFHRSEKIFFFLMSLLFFIGTNANAQEANKHIRDGNKEYAESHYADAQKEYEKAVQEKSNIAGAFNLGDAYYKQKKYKEAADQFQSIVTQKTDKNTLAKAYHNLGNSLLQDKKYEESIKAYKNSLLNNPKDDNTRYNLAYAQEKLRQKQNQDKKKQQDKDKKNQDQKQQQKQKQDQKNKSDKDKQNQNQKNQQQQPQNNKISKADAQRLLDAMNDDEKKLQEKLAKKKAPATKAEIQKNW